MTGWYTKRHIKEVEETKEDSSQTTNTYFDTPSISMRIQNTITSAWIIWAYLTLLLILGGGSAFSLAVITLIAAIICVAIAGLFDRDNGFDLAIMLSLLYFIYILIIIVLSVLLGAVQVNK